MTPSQGTATEVGRMHAAMAISSPAAALWNQRRKLGSLREKYRAMIAAVGRPSNLTLHQWGQISAFALEYRPDLIIELGRLSGNSTCCFLEVANQLGGSASCRVLSLCLSDDWFKTTVPRLRKIVTSEWFAPGEILQCNIFDYEFSVVLKRTQRCLIFWDAHGFELAEFVLGSLLPGLLDKTHVVLMHDLTDRRYHDLRRDYGGEGLWKGESEGGPYIWLGHIVSHVAQAVSVLDFTARNDLPIHSAEESLNTEIGGDPVKLRELRELLGDDLFSLHAEWFWFSLNEGTRDLVFPAFRRSPREIQTVEARAQSERLRDALDLLKQRLEASRLDGRQREAGAESLESAVDAAHAALRAYGQVQERLISENEELERRLRTEANSIGGRILKACRTALDRSAPAGTRRRNLYERAARGLRGTSGRA